MKTSKYVTKYARDVLTLNTRAKAVNAIIQKLMNEAKEEMFENNIFFPDQVVEVFEKKNKKWNKIISHITDPTNPDTNIWLTDDLTGLDQDLFIGFIKDKDPDLFTSAELAHDIDNVLRQGSGVVEKTDI